MSYSESFSTFLAKNKVVFDTLSTSNALSPYEVCKELHLELGDFVSTVLLTDRLGHYVMALIPGDFGIDIQAVSTLFKRPMFLSSSHALQEKLAQAVPDWLPPVGEWYKVKMIVEKQLLDKPNLYIASGDCNTIYKIDSAGFKSLVKSAAPLHFAERVVDGRASTVAATDEQIEHLLRQVDEAKNAVERPVPRSKVQLDQLPPMSDLTARLLAIRAKKNIDISELAKVIEQDPSITAQLLRYASSALFHYQGKLGSIKEAIFHVLGTETALDIALGLAIGKLFTGPQHGPVGSHNLWKTAFLTATFARELAIRLPHLSEQQQSEVYLGALLHNFGYFVLANMHPQVYGMYNKLLEKPLTHSPLVVEKQLFGASHIQMGYHTLVQWGLPMSVAESVGYHLHANYEGPNPLIVDTVRVAVQWLKSYQLGGQKSLQRESKTRLASFSLDHDLLQELLEETIAQLPVIEGVVEQLAA